MRTPSSILAGLLSATALTLSGCAVTHAGLKSDDGRTVARSIHDINAARTIRARMMRAHGFKLGGVDVEVREGTALLSGRVPRPEDRVEAERIAWSAPRIHNIGNEVVIGDKQGLVRNTKDGLLEKSVRTRLIASDARARNLNIETHEGVVYLLGMVDDAAERDTATRVASTTRGVREVVSYITVRDGFDRDAAPTAVAARPVAPPVTRPTLPMPSPVPRDDRIPAPAYEMPEEVVPASPVVPVSPVLPMSPLSRVPGAGAVTVETIDPPEDTGGAPFYIDPDSGTRIPVRYDGRTGSYLVVE